MNNVAGSIMAKSDRPKRDDKAVKIERELASKARIIAEQLGYDSAAEYLSELVRPGITRDWPKAMKKLNAPTSGDEVE